MSSAKKSSVKPPQPPKPTNLNLNMKLNRFVYTKYRAMLGSYNDKANEIIQSLPTKKTILQQMDRRFCMATIKKSTSAPPPPPMLNGSLPTRRLQTQPQQEMPSCVQNAMMTKDKKPFTYTPGGIDLSQIKSPRMAQRISRNANMEGVTNQPKPSPLAQQHITNTGAAPSPPPSTLGMPVQVFPQGPPPPPPAPKPAQLNPANGNRSPSVTRKSPQPQSFEPPPFGFRPEIKIPTNPMAALRKVPLPKPKEADWGEEFRKERSKSPMPPSMAAPNATNVSDIQLPEPVKEFNVQPTNQVAYDQVDSPTNTAYLARQVSQKENDNSFRDQNNNFSNQNVGGNFSPSSPQQRVFSPFASSPQPNLPKPLSPIKMPHQDENIPIYVRSSQRATSPKPPTPQFEHVQSPTAHLQRQPSLEPVQTPIYTRTTRNVSASPVKQLNQSTFQPNANDQTENFPIYVRSFQKGPAPAPPTAAAPAPVQTQAPTNYSQPLSTAQPFVNEPGRQYYQPNRATNQTSPGTANGNHQMPPWMRRSNSKEIPEWASNADEFNHNTTPSNSQPSTFAAPKYPANGSTQYANDYPNAAAPQERVVPIQFEQSPVKTPTTPGFTAQPYQSTPPQYNRVQPPQAHPSTFTPAASNYASTYNDPHKFVDQGYNNVHNWDISQRVMSPTQSDGSRVIPIKLEDGHPYLNGPVSQSPHVIQSDARSTPNQSKSFRVLQQITDTIKIDPHETAALTKPAELHQPHYSRPLGPSDMNEHQLRKMKLNDDVPKNQSFENRFQQQFPDWVPSKPHSVLHSVMRPDNDADVQVLDTEYDHMSSFSHLDSYSDYPYTVSMPPDTPLPSECDDSIRTVDAVPIRDNDLYSSCIYDSYYDKSKPRSRRMSTHSDSATVVPRIVITPTPEDNEKRRASLTESSRRSSINSETFEMLSSKLNQLSSNGIERASTPNNHDNQRIYSNERKMSTSSIQSANGKILHQSQELDSSQSESDSESDISHSKSNEATAARKYDYQRNDSLYEIEDIHESEVLSDDESADIIEFIIQNGDEMSNCDTVEFNDHLSVIFEEDEHSHNRRQKLDSICSSNSSATLANDDNESKHFHSEEDNEDDDDSSTVESDNESGTETDTNNEYTDNEDDQSTSVTVRLPLRLSFSRSSNDEEVTTVMVGKSEIQFEEKLQSIKSIESSDSSPDVSVSFSLRPRSRPTFREQSSFDTSNNKSIDNDDDSEVSVSFSLPVKQRTVCQSPLIRRPIFMRQQTLSPVPRNRDEFEYKVWNRGFSIERDMAIQKPFHHQVPLCADVKLQAPVSSDVEPEKLSVREKIASFNIAVGKKEELQRQNAFTSFDESVEQNDHECDQQIYSKPQNDDILDQYSNGSIHELGSSSNKTNGIVPETTTNYESYVTNQYTGFESHGHIQSQYEQQSHEEQPQYVEPNDEIESPEQDYKANLSVQQKIAAFEQPASNAPTKIDARREINAAREINEENVDELKQMGTVTPNLVENRIIQPIATEPQLANTQTECQLNEKPNEYQNGTSKLTRNSYMQRSLLEESEIEETDSGVDIHRRMSEDIDTESECYSELRKLTRYERAATHSRLFKLLQEYETESETDKPKEEEIIPFSRPKKIIHNVSITRKQNPELAKQAETMAERRERLHLNYNGSSLDTDNASSSASPSCLSPTPSVNEKLIDELVHSVLQQTKRRNLRHIPIDKIQAAARRALIQQHEENDSCDTFSSFDSTPALTPQEFHDDYYDSDSDRHMDIMPSKAFKHLQEQSSSGRRSKLWAARCPRVLSSKTVNSDLSRLTETRESQTPEREQQYAYPH